MNDKFSKNAKVEKLTNLVGKAVRLIVIDPFLLNVPYKMFRIGPKIKVGRRTVNTHIFFLGLGMDEEEIKFTEGTLRML